jgi:hypothetical protein
MLVKSKLSKVFAFSIMLSLVAVPALADSAAKRAAQSRLGMNYRGCLIEAAQHAHYKRGASVSLSLEAADAVCMPQLRRFSATYPGPISQQLRRAYLEAIYEMLVRGLATAMAIRVHSVLIAASLAAHIAPAYAAPLSAKEKKAYACVLKQAHNETGNPEVAAYYAAESCPMQGLKEAQRRRVIDMTIRQLMKEYGMECIGTGCG